MVHRDRFKLHDVGRVRGVEKFLEMVKMDILFNLAKINAFSKLLLHVLSLL